VLVSLGYVLVGTNTRSPAAERGISPSQLVQELLWKALTERRTSTLDGHQWVEKVWRGGDRRFAMNDEKNQQRYSAALDLLGQERQLFWQTFSAFLLAHTVFMAFLLQAVSRSDIPSWSPGLWLTSWLGFMLCGPWLAAQWRTSAYNDLRMAQAREAEPVPWKLLRDIGQAFAEGNRVTIEERPFQLPRLIRRLRLRTTYSVMALIGLFAAMYVVIFILTGPWSPPRVSILL